MFVFLLVRVVVCRVSFCIPFCSSHCLFVWLSLLFIAWECDIVRIAFMSVCLCVHVSLSVCLCVYVSVCLFVCVFMLVCLCVYVSVCLFVCVFMLVCLFVFVLMFQFVHISVFFVLPVRAWHNSYCFYVTHPAFHM